MTYVKKSPEELREILTPMQYHVTQENGTEPPFQNEFNRHFRQGLYLDVTTGEPLFSSEDKFPTSCGWPSFSRPLQEAAIVEKRDVSLGLVRTEVRSRIGDAHLGHLFPDGPPKEGGLRYCINSAALRFIPREELEQEGYGDWLHLFEEED